MAQHDAFKRFTHTRLFREYTWLSDAFLSGNWVQVASDVGGLKDYAKFLLQLDHQVPLHSSTDYSDAEFRALLGLTNVHGLDANRVASNSKSMSKCWTILLRFQVLDVLLATMSGTSEMPCLVRPMPTGTQQVDVSPRSIKSSMFVDITSLQLLASLSTWQTRFSTFQTAWRNKIDQERKESKKKGQKAKTTIMEIAPTDGQSSEAWALVQQLSGMTTKSFVQKTIKNLQAMGTALTWILEAMFATFCIAPKTDAVLSHEHLLRNSTLPPYALIHYIKRLRPLPLSREC